jgi:hypothetical protein
VSIRNISSCKNRQDLAPKWHTIRAAKTTKAYNNNKKHGIVKHGISITIEHFEKTSTKQTTA